MQKNTNQYTERDEEKRKAFIAEIEALLNDSKLYYIDETGFDEFYHKEYSYAPSGQKIVAKVAGTKFARTNVVAAQFEKQIIAPFAFSGSMNHSLCEGWLQEILAKGLEEPQKSVIILDNASFIESKPFMT